MAVDRLQEKIRKGKTTLMLEFSGFPDCIPPQYLNQDAEIPAAASAYCRELMIGLKGMICGVRFSFAAFALLGFNGLAILSELMKKAASLGYYVLLDAPELYGPEMAEQTAKTIWGEGSPYPCDGMVIHPYLGSDVIRPFLPYCREKKKDLFVQVRSGNKSASELQDLLSGSRVVHAAAADYVNRFGGDTHGKYGYSRVGVLVPANAANTLKNLRTKYQNLFMIVDGMEYPGAFGKNCAYAFDKLGHGAVVCVSGMVTCAWKKEEGEPLALAAAALEKLQKNLGRYITVL